MNLFRWIYTKWNSCFRNESKKSKTDDVQHTFEKSVVPPKVAAPKDIEYNVRNGLTEAGVQELIDAIIQQTMEHVPEFGDFTPVMEFMSNPDSLTQEFVGKFGLRVFKMPYDVVRDPRKRYVEAAAYVPSGIYKSTWVIASGDKNEVLEIMQSKSFPKKLIDAFIKLEEQFEHYD